MVVKLQPGHRLGGEAQRQSACGFGIGENALKPQWSHPEHDGDSPQGCHGCQQGHLLPTQNYPRFELETKVIRESVPLYSAGPLPLLGTGARKKHMAKKKKERHEKQQDKKAIQGELVTDVPARLVDNLPTRLPILVSTMGPVFPGMMSPVPVEDERSRRTLETSPTFVGLLALRPEAGRPEPPVAPEDLYDVGAVGRLVRPFQLQDGSAGYAVVGIRRVLVKAYVTTDPILLAEVEYPEDRVASQRETDALYQRVRASFRQLVDANSEMPDELLQVLEQLADPSALSAFVAANLGPDIATRQEILADFELGSRLRRALTLVEKQLDLAELGAKIQAEIRAKFERQQREHFLREQLQAIRKELGEEVDQRQLDRDTYLQKIDEAGMTGEAEERARKELDRLGLLPPEASEYHVIRNYLDWLVELPWSKESRELVDVVRARKVLDEDHHGLEEVKDRIVEFLAVRKLRPDQQGAILCLVGPPGVGKTSLGRSVARATGREFYRFALGGMRDESEIKGHRRTYVGAMPGKIIQGLRRVETRNPVFMLDELDKIGSDWRGDPASALLEVLDPAQNHSFSDHYLDLPFDLSRVLFIATANVSANIPAPLLDRTELISLPGYLPQEKQAIGVSYLFPRQLEAHGLSRKQLKIPKRTVGAIVEGYTREAGVRQLERSLGRICRKTAARVAELQDPSQAKVTNVAPDNLSEYLGPRRFHRELAERVCRPGVVVGLAWTAVGGEILFIEATAMAGSGRFQLTGKLGEVMSESARIAYSLVRSRADQFAIPHRFFKERDIHLHVPAGAVPKDGPSAGVAMTCALLSLLWRGKGRVARSRVAMTGEITLGARSCRWVDSGKRSSEPRLQE